MLAGTYMVRQLQPWHENLGKRQVKAPKIYLRDSGLLHALLDLPDRRALHGHPRVGLSWEGFAIEDLRLHHLWVVHPGRYRYDADKRITMWSIADVALLAADIIRRTRRTGAGASIPKSPSSRPATRASVARRVEPRSR